MKKNSLVRAIKRAQEEVATWSPEKRASVQLQGYSPAYERMKQIQATKAEKKKKK